MLGGVLADLDWRAVFWINVPIGVVGTVWAYLALHEIAASGTAKIDWLGNVTFAIGPGCCCVGITYGIQPYGTAAARVGQSLRASRHWRRAAVPRRVLLRRDPRAKHR